MPEKPDAIHMAIVNSHTSLTDSQEPFLRSIGNVMVMTGKSAQHPISAIRGSVKLWRLQRILDDQLDRVIVSASPFR